MGLFPVRLKILREQSGYRSQLALANELGVAQSTVGGWESGKREPNHEMTIRLANLFGVSVDYLIGNVDTPKTAKAPIPKDERPIRDNDIKLALFGSVEIPEVMYEEVRAFAAFVKQRAESRPLRPGVD